MTDKEIDRIRERIDEIDDRLLRLLNDRATLVVELAKLKHEHGLQLFDPERERQIHARLAEANGGPLPPDAVARVFERIIDEARRLERTEVYDKAEE